MNKLYLLLVSAFVLISGPFDRLNAQCPASYTQAQLNWDNLDLYYNSGLNVAPYGYRVSSTNFTYVTDAMEQTQRFAIGSNYLTLATSNAAIINPGAGLSAENATHTGELAGYTGEDAQFNPNANGQTITITFNNPVRNVFFTLYDIDRAAVITVTAADASAVPLVVNAATQGGTILTVAGAPGKVISDLTNTALGNASNAGSATIGVAGTALTPVKTITITCTTIGTDPVFWMSDINACVTGSFPTNYHQATSNRPFVGPTQNMPDYFLVTPDNNSAYYLDPATGRARELFIDATRNYINSFGYDPFNKYLYYINENTTVDYTNKQIKRYDYITETSSVWVTDVTAAPLNIPTFNSGIESAGCAYYDGALYFGIEGGTHSNGGSPATITTRETIIYRINMDASNNPVSAVQVYATNASTSGTGTQTSIHDWGDFIIKNGVIYNFNTARNSCGMGCSNYAQSKFHHYDLMTGAVTNVYNNPGTTTWNGQAGMTWNQGLYYFRPGAGTNSVVGSYNEAGVCGASTTITVVGGGTAWPGGSGDASDPFRPKCDFGDAPASYDPYSDPATQSPAVHERADTMWIGTTTSQATSWSREYFKIGTTGSDDTDNGIATVPFLQPGPSTASYLVQVSLYNNTTSNARLIAWLDFNGNGTFDAAEAATLIPAGDITPSSSVQTRYLYWPSISVSGSLTAGTYTYLRMRITNATAGMTTSHATGYFEKGEVEDYRVPVDNFPLASQLLDFKAMLENKTVKLDWKVAEDANVFSYEVERSLDNNNWTKVTTTQAKGTNGTWSYQSADNSPLKGKSFYRLKIIEGTGFSYSPVRTVSFDEFNFNLVDIFPVPAKDKVSLKVDINEAADAEIELLNAQGKIVYTGRRKLEGGQQVIDLTFPPGISSGVYLLRITAGGKLIREKLVITK
ncbi:MAG: T9SS type A sorting domain-containing protein [Chitinophagaceae bacterium]|nr:T9SS type A sorting domain-containing protein [Chitinophagaceae bacterium]